MCLQANADQQEEDESKWAATKGMQYSARGRKLTFSNKAIFQMVALIILDFGLSYMFVSQSIPRLDDVNGNARVQAYSECSNPKPQGLTCLY